MVQKILNFINENEILAYDTETTGLNVRKDTIIGFGISNSVTGFYIDLWRYDTTVGRLVPGSFSTQDALIVLNALLNKKLICFNASFDCRMTQSNFGVNLLPALYCDAMLLKHTCDEDFPFGLKEIATKLWGTDAKQEKIEMQSSIKANGGKATDYYKASVELLAAYCIKDCLLTARVYEHYNRDLDAQGLSSFFYNDEVMPLYREVTIPMEMTGVCLNVPLMLQMQKDVENDIVALEAEIQHEIAPNLSLFTEWFLHKDYPLQTFTGKQPLWAKSGLTQQQAFERDYPGQFMFNLQSKHHLKKLLFDTLGLEPLSRTPTGLPQVDDEFLASIAPQHNWVAKLQVYNKLNKLKATYIDRLLAEQEHGIFYPSFAQHRTVSGRYAGDMQQLPRPIADDGGLVTKYTNSIRKFIIARPGHQLCSADYEQLEPSIFAHTSGDPALQQIFTEGKDFYSEIAIRTEGLEGSSDKTAPNYLGKINKLARQNAKVYALGIPYGLTGYKLKFEIGVSDVEAEKLVQDYLRAFPGLDAWMQSSKLQACTTGAVTSQAGRIRHLRRAKQLWAKYGAPIRDGLQLWKAYHSNPEKYAVAKKDYKEFKNLCNNAINFQVQSLAASIVSRASININRILIEKHLKTKLVSSIHDELVFDVPLCEVSVVGPIIKHEMESVVELAVAIRTTPQFGNTFAECK